MPESTRPARAVALFRGNADVKGTRVLAESESQSAPASARVIERKVDSVALRNFQAPRPCSPIRNHATPGRAFNSPPPVSLWRWLPPALESIFEKGEAATDLPDSGPWACGDLP